MPWFLALPFMLVLKASLWLIGFGSAGPIAGSLAALIQAVVYGAAVPAGGVFAFLQHLAMVLP
ncbi:hypothetical protein C8035_v008269 [Colletotrichum spinosum]|uniref:Uncharacterized protein n=1 Tax=Colletotrichum spinosum TaxID=1347390 RepID=A0A4R8QLN0_9PEZI|nr:hypothetical protein C8035_v008269 [Colletotrichum spinosum]